MNINSNFIPKIAENIAYSTRDGKHLFINPDIPDWVVLNENAAYIVGNIDGISSLDEIFTRIESDLNSVDKTDFYNLFENLQEHGIINYSASESAVSCGCSEGHKRLLHSVHLKLTDECNLHCLYCYAESESCNKGFFDFQKLKDISDEVKSLYGNVEFILSGGEPLLHPNIFDYAQYLQDSGHTVHLLTNGTQVTPENAPLISQYFKLIKISIDGSNENVNALTRNKGSFQKSLNGYELLMAENANVYVSMTVTKANIHDVNAMVQKFGNRLTFQPFFEAGRGSDNPDKLGITGSEYYEALASVEGVKPLGSIATLLEGIRRRGTTKCAMADSEISISENGDVYPCQMLTDEEFKGGNIFENTIPEILNSQTFQELIIFSSKTNEECSVCPIKLICGGACRARSYYQTGDIFKNSDFCEYEKLAYINGIFDSYEFSAN